MFVVSFRLSIKNNDKNFIDKVVNFFQFDIGRGMKNLIYAMAIILNTTLHATEPVSQEQLRADSVEAMSQEDESLLINSDAEYEANNDNLFMLDKGFRLRTQSIYKHYTFVPLILDEIWLARQIRRGNPKLPESEVQILQKTIRKVSACFNIDAWMLTGLIYKESTFVKNAVSPTNAVGLTQFTTKGIMEVHDQLGHNGIIGAPEEITTYFRNKVYQCINPKWIDPWSMVKSLPGTTRFHNDIKNILKKDHLISVTYGAILLKTFLAYLDNRNDAENLKMTMPELYYNAFQRYNGEEGDAKVRYAQTIFKLVKGMHPWPHKVTYPFMK